MKIIDVKTVLLTGPLSKDPYILEARKLRSAAFIEIHTDAGFIGIGETYAGYFYPEAVPGIVDFFKPILVGQEGSNIEELRERMFRCGSFWCRVGLGAIIISGIESALWDLQGKIQDKPVYQLLGGACHERLPCYATGGVANYPKDRLAQKLDYYLGLGFKAFKVSAGLMLNGEDFDTTPDFSSVPDFEADKAAFMRAHVGPNVRICLDGHMDNNNLNTWNLKTAIEVMKAVEPYDIFFFEEPLPYNNHQDYAELTKVSKVPIAGGECLSTMSEWRAYIQNGSFAIAQPDASFNGGLLETMKIAHAWGKQGKKIATHAWGSGGSLMQNVHCGFAADNTCILEIPPGFGPLHEEVAGDSFQMKDGHVQLPQTPGLGIQLTQKLKDRYPFVPGSGEFNPVPGKPLDI